jgi:hypothetical protein
VLCVVSATGRSLVQRSPTECGVSECDREASIMRRPMLTFITHFEEEEEDYVRRM